MQAQAKMERATASHAVLAGPVPEDGNRLRVLHVISYMDRAGAQMDIPKLTAEFGEYFDHRICTAGAVDTDLVLWHFSHKNMYVGGIKVCDLQCPLFRKSPIMRQYPPVIA